MIKLAINNNEFCDLAILDRVMADPDISQAALAEDLQVAIGTINRRLQQMVEKGYVQVERTRRRKLRYKITQAGHAFHRILTSVFIEQSFQLYRQVRQQVKNVMKRLNDADVHTVRMVGEGDVAEICRLTCLEHYITITDNSEVPALVVDGLDIRIESLEKITDKSENNGEFNELV
jgi:DNA-binding MarR family transcriptional regulator